MVSRWKWKWNIDDWDVIRIMNYYENKHNNFCLCDKILAHFSGTVKSAYVE